MKLTEPQLEKTSEYLIDLSKLLVGSTFVSIFAPGITGKDFNLLTFSFGIILAVLALLLGLKFLPTSKL